MKRQRSLFPLASVRAGDDDLVVDLYAGGGGASVGIEAAIGRKVDIAINHDAVAMAVHKANHPETLHLEADIWEVKPIEATGGRPVGLLWASPDCTHFSVAKGGKPRKQNIRSLAQAVTWWAKEVRPAVIFLENVREFRDWGPLLPNGKPNPAKKGQTFKRWVRKLVKLGYEVEYRILDASLYGAPTRRRRLFLVARCDGQPITWPEPTHGPGRLPLRTAAECIDWSIPCPSIFDRKKPLKDKTLWRIAQGLRRFVLENPRPFVIRYNHPGGPFRGQDTDEPLTTLDTSNRFGLVSPVVAGVGGRAGQSPAIPGDAPLGTVTAKNDRAVIVPSLVNLSHGGRVEPLDDPLRVVTASPKGGDRALIIPSLVEMNHANAPHGVDEPLGVVTTQDNRFNLVAPSLVKVNHGKQEARGESIEEPLSTVTATQRGHAIIAPSLMKVRFDSTGAPIDEPMPTITAGGHQRPERPATGNPLGIIAPTLVQTSWGEREGQRPRYLDLQEPLGTVVAGGVKHAVVAAHLQRDFGKSIGADLEEPAPTVMPGGGGKAALVTGFLAKHFGERPGGFNGGSDLDAPAGTVTTKDHHALAAASLVKLRGQCHGADLEEPMPTVTAGGFHVAEVRAFLTAYYGTDGTEGKGQSLFEPLRTVTTKARLGLVTIEGTEYQIVDIGMRMLDPHELLAAQFGRFAADYDLSKARTKAAKVRLIGNSVCPEMAEAVVRANIAEPVDQEAVA